MNSVKIRLERFIKNGLLRLVNLVMQTPLLVKFSPAPILKIVGSLSQRASVLQALGQPA